MAEIIKYQISGYMKLPKKSHFQAFPERLHLISREICHFYTECGRFILLQRFLSQIYIRVENEKLTSLQK